MKLELSTTPTWLVRTVTPDVCELFVFHPFSALLVLQVGAWLIICLFSAFHEFRWFVTKLGCHRVPSALLITSDLASPGGHMCWRPCVACIGSQSIAGFAEKENVVRPMYLPCCKWFDGKASGRIIPRIQVVKNAG